MVLMVSSVKMELFGVNQHEGKKNHQDLYWILASVNEVAIEDVGSLRWWEAILSQKEDKSKKWQQRKGIENQVKPMGIWQLHKIEYQFRVFWLSSKCELIKDGSICFYWSYISF